MRIEFRYKPIFQKKLKTGILSLPRLRVRWKISKYHIKDGLFIKTAVNVYTILNDILNQQNI